MRLAEFNAQPAGPARRMLLECCASAGWAGQVAEGRPYASVADVLSASDQAVAGLTRGDLEEALAGHPRIGARAAGWSRQEQAGAASADAATAAALADGNRRYEQRFGHIYLVCATGRSGAELLAMLHERLNNDPDAEWRVVRAELGKINRIRLGNLLSGPDQAGEAAGGWPVNLKGAG
jgi:2-oxo-4-hydroxy-4-carboxy-5-ureidoimidazoline decarboxylase